MACLVGYLIGGCRRISGSADARLVASSSSSFGDVCSWRVVRVVKHVFVVGAHDGADWCVVVNGGGHERFAGGDGGGGGEHRFGVVGGDDDDAGGVGDDEVVGADGDAGEVDIGVPGVFLGSSASGAW